MRTAAIAVLGLVLSMVTDAEAAPTSQDRAVAEQLFRDAKRLAKGGDFDAACPKFAESQRLDPQLGTLLHLATCHEQQGLTATAWAEYSEAVDRATEQGEPKRARLARERADALEASLSRLRVKSLGAHDELEVVLDDVVLGPASLASSLPVDPGEHVIEARAPGHRPWQKTLSIPEGPAETEVVVPVLERSSDGGDDASLVAPTGTGDGQRLAGWIVGGVGVVGFAIMAGFGARAASQASSADDECEGRFCSQSGLDGHAAARTSATVATVGFVLGVIGVGTGITLLLTAPSDDADVSTTAFVAPRFGPDGGGLTMGVGW